MAPDRGGDSFALVRGVAAIFATFPRPWYVAGGWGIDLFLGQVTRTHDDVEITILREDQGVLRAQLAGWHLSYIDDRQATATWTPWETDTWLEPPDFQIGARRLDSELAVLDVFLNDVSGGQLHFRRDPAITLPIEWMGGRSAVDGIPYVAPEMLLLYKAKYHRPKDELDFDAAAPHLTPAQRSWLREALLADRPADPWLAALE